MKKTNLYIYPNVNGHVHDKSEHYKNTIPLSEQGISKYFNITGPEEAEYYYMGQLQNEKFYNLSPESYKYFLGNEKRHICDIEGEGGLPIPSWLGTSIITTMGPLKKHSNFYRLFARPTFSHLLIDIVKNRNEQFSKPNKVSFGFRGYMNHRTRAMLLHSLHNSDFEKEVHIKKTWSGPSKIGCKVQQEYIETMNNNLISLCPRGSGIDSVRLIESCYYNRVPVLISDEDYYLVGEHEEDLDFIFRVTGNHLTPALMIAELEKIYNTPLSELYDRADKARKYFDNTIRKYFEDPTLYFLNWLNNT